MCRGSMGAKSIRKAAEAMRRVPGTSLEEIIGFKGPNISET